MLQECENANAMNENIIYDNESPKSGVKNSSYDVTSLAIKKQQSSPEIETTVLPSVSFTPLDLQQKFISVTPNSFETVEMSPLVCTRSEVENAVLDIVNVQLATPNTSIGIERLISDEMNVGQRQAGAEAEDVKGDEEENEQEETERIRREEASERLAWELMQQESLDTYNMQLQFMAQNAESLSAEDLAAIQAAVRESQPVASLVPTRVLDAQGQGDENEAVAQEGDGDGEDHNGKDNDDVNQSDMSDPDQWDYERLLRLGEVIGDVKTERWRLRSQSIIDKLPKITFGSLLVHVNDGLNSSITQPPPPVDFVNERTESTQAAQTLPSVAPLIKKLRRLDHRCTVCMDAFEEPDELVVLRCSHYFHSLCAVGWLKDHNSCPFCKQKITESP